MENIVPVLPCSGMQLVVTSISFSILSLLYHSLSTVSQLIKTKSHASFHDIINLWFIGQIFCQSTLLEYEVVIHPTVFH